MYREGLPSRLKNARLENNYSQYKVAELLKLKQPTIASYEAGRTEPDIETLGKLAVLYCHTVDYFLGLADD